MSAGTTEDADVQYRGVCDNCGAIRFDDHPDGDFGPKCPGCEAVLRLVEIHDAETDLSNAIEADDLREAHESLLALDAEFPSADAETKSEQVLDFVGVGP